MDENHVGKGRAGRFAVGVLLALSLVLSAGSAGFLVWEHTAGQSAGSESAPTAVSSGESSEESAGEAYRIGEKYTLFIGLNDKDEHEQLVSSAKARKTVDAICARHGLGFTVLSAEGGWAGKEGTEEVEKENTLVYLFYDADEEQVEEVADEAAAALNQASVLVERTETSYAYRP